MLSQPPETTDTAASGRLLRAIGAALAVGLLAAFWMLCSHQVRKAQMRDLTVEVQSVAIGECLQYIPRATLSSCADRVDPYRRGSNAAMPASGDKLQAPPQAARARPGSTAPVTVSY